MSDIEVGEYVRTEKGIIGKFKGYSPSIIFASDDIELDHCTIGFDEDKIKAHSKNIINLIEDGDIVCIKDIMYDSEYKSEVFENFDNILCINNSEGDKIIELSENIENKQIELLSILTHEQYEQNCYKVGDIK